MVIAIVALGALYASPNLYGEDHAVQISAGRNAEINQALVEQVTSHLDASEINVKKIELIDDRILVRLDNNDVQLQAKEAIESVLSEDYVVALNLAPAMPDWLASLGGNPMKLGLDLRGGVHFLMEVDMNTAMERAFNQLKEDFRVSLREEKIRFRTVKVVDDSLLIQFRKQDDLDKALYFLRSNNRDLNFIEKEGLFLKATFSEQRLKQTRDNAIKQNITIIRNRVNQLGVAEPLVQKQGAERIVVQLPGIQDTARAKEILGATATLEFRLLELGTDVRDAVAGRVPPNAELLFQRDGTPVLVKKSIMLTGEHIVDASPSYDEYGRPQVNITLDAKGGAKMSKATRGNVGKPMATIFIESKATKERDANGKLIFTKHAEVIQVATIQSQLGSKFRTTGIDSPAQAQNLSLLLRAGALIAPIQIVEERTVGPSLGQENIDLGVTAIVYGFALILIFMAVYYRGFGLIANLALAVNLILIVGLMSLIPGATLTLPGMAGIVLTVGMAVDANVLIFERIREELREGRGVQQAIHQGYDSALSTIADANITTLIAALVLFGVGTGPVKGFAVTLMIGIITSMFTAIVGTRAVVNLVWGGKRVTKLSI